MTDLEKDFLDEFIAVEKICNDMFGCKLGVSQYIDTMKQYGPQDYIVPTWRNDFNMLMRLRAIRNKISHEGISDCDYDDYENIKDFHNRLLSREDPLARLNAYYEARRRAEEERRRAQRQWEQQQTAKQSQPTYTMPVGDGRYNSDAPQDQSKAGCIWAVVIVIAIAAVVVFLARYFHIL